MNRRRTTIAALAALLVATPALAQTPKAAEAWPTKPVRILVGFPAGSSPDLVARALAEPLSKAWGQPVIVENKPGAGGNIAADQVAKATDDHTLGVLINGNMTIAKILSPATPFDPLTDLTPVSQVGTAPLVLAASGGIPGTDAAFLAAAREAGNKWSYGSPGVGTVGHIGMELLKSKAGIDPVHVPYPGNPQVITAIIGGQLQLALLPPALAMAQVRAGKMRAIGVTSAERSPLVPELQSLADVGLKDFNLEIWTAVAAPKSMPRDLVARISALVGETVRAPAMREKLAQQGWKAVGSSQEALADRIKSDTALLGGVITKLGVRAE
ncbi:MAG: tripartite tricarboxylate transporter substrate binding protein [Betaproteobacteria bacterium]|nr:tripartite tricarboxylate transporter substrate binding protein [Betaproteobacteria bacterium]